MTIPTYKAHLLQVVTLQYCDIYSMPILSFWMWICVHMSTLGTHPHFVLDHGCLIWKKNGPGEPINTLKIIKIAQAILEKKNYEHKPSTI